MDSFTSKQLIQLGELQTELSLVLHAIYNPGTGTPPLKNETMRKIYNKIVLMREQIEELKTEQNNKQS